mmetsp:Transcript_10591/g.43787  ORF Transcript_10591/g.43787 Transcript_10591/m.43787 type:complete len:284 (+) Transcript_10591:2071-2922(+)
MFPGCKSAFQMPSSKNWHASDRPIASHVASRSTPYSRSASSSVSLNAFEMNSMISTSRCADTSRGALQPVLAMPTRTRSMACPSCSRSSSLSTVLQMYSASSRRSWSGQIHATARASARVKNMSCRKSGSTPRLRTLTATSTPPTVTARWTCAMLADPTGVASNSSKESSMRATPSASHTEAWISSVGRGGTASCSAASGRTRTAGIVSGLALMLCPILIHMPPWSTQKSSNRSPHHACTRSHSLAARSSSSRSAARRASAKSGMMRAYSPSVASARSSNPPS